MALRIFLPFRQKKSIPDLLEVTTDLLASSLYGLLIYAAKLYLCAVMFYVLCISVSQEPEDILYNKDQRNPAPQPVIEAKHIPQFRTESSVST